MPPKDDRKPLLTKVWRSMRILRRFNYADIVRTVAVSCTDLELRAIRRQLKRLAVHSVIEPIGPQDLHKKAGDFGAYRLVRDSGPEMPELCELCGARIGTNHCAPAKQRQTERATAANDRKREQERDDIAIVSEAAPRLDAMLRGEVHYDHA